MIQRASDRPLVATSQRKGVHMAKKVIDVSEHQGKIDWEKVKGNIDGAILRCGYGMDQTNQDDEQWKRNLSECERLGIPVGVYLYSYANTEAKAKSELSHILRLIKGHKFQLPIFIDLEQSGTEKMAKKTAQIVCDGLKDAGYTPGVYANLNWIYIPLCFYLYCGRKINLITVIIIYIPLCFYLYPGMRRSSASTI